MNNGSGPIMRLVLLLALLLQVPAALAAELKPFTTDGCTDFPDGVQGHEDLWLDCCVAHDYAYWKGGTREERRKADRELRQCVARVGHPVIANIMLAGVRVGGSPYWPTEFRWGYGWPYGRGYRPLSEEEKRQVERLTPPAVKKLLQRLAGEGSPDALQLPKSLKEQTR